MNAMKKGLALVVAAAASAGAMAQATGPDLTSLTSVVKFDTVTASVLSIAGLLAGVYIAIRGASIVLGMLRGGR